MESNLKTVSLVIKNMKWIKLKKEGGECCQFIKIKNIEKLENTAKLIHRN